MNVSNSRVLQVKYRDPERPDSQRAPTSSACSTRRGTRCQGIRYLAFSGLCAGVSLAAFIGGFVPSLAIAALSDDQCRYRIHDRRQRRDASDGTNLQ